MRHDTEAQPMAENPEAGTNKILGEQQVVDTGPVDSVGGAKPEPEERPLMEHRVLEPNKMQLSSGEIMHAARNMNVYIESTVGRELQAFGKQCGRCKHYSHKAGQLEIAKIQQFGDPEDKAMLKELRAQLLETGVVNVMGDYVGAAEIFHDETADFVREMGACVKASAEKKDVQLLHPSQNCCPMKFADNTPWPFWYEARTSEIEREDNELYTNLMHSASVK